MPGTALAKLQDEKGAVALISEAADRIEPFLPKGTDLMRVALTVRIAIRKTPALLKCSPESILTAVAQVQQWGLEIGTTAHLVPFGEECTAIADYKGLAELIVASGAIRHVEGRCVYANEPFVYEQGLDPKLEHHPIADVATRGKLVAAYVVFHLPFGRRVFEVMAAGDAEAVRQKYSKQWKSGELPDWYCLKTCLRRAVKLIPKNPKLRDALRVIEQDEEREGEFEVANERPSGEPGAVTNPTGATTPSPAASPAPATSPSSEAASNGSMPQPAPAGAPKSSKVITPTSITDEDLAWAAKVKLLGKPDKWGGNGSKPMGELPTSLLEQVRDFFAKKRSEVGEPDERLDTQIRAAAIILADREREQGTLELEAEEDVPDELPKALKDEDDDGLPF